MILPLQNQPKHERYAAAYRRFGYFWGLGIEHETYLATTQSHAITTFEGKMKPERYSVDYYKAYNSETLTPILQNILDICGGSITVPILMNGHSLTRCDVSGQHATVFAKGTPPNPQFAGQTLFEYLCEHSEWLRKELDSTYMWDGDTVEFMTQKFYRTTLDSVLTELVDIETRFIAEVAKAQPVGLLASHGPLRLASPVNEPFATYLTNPGAVSMFNNGTIHINVTLPTQLGFDKKPMWPADFLEKHRRLARLIQWLEPLWLAVHGSPDPFSAVSDRYATGSQRVAVSRYIGLGTYDTTAMAAGKILQVQRADVTSPWYDRLYAATDYIARPEIGLDLNYNKHWAHGLELRFFDQLPVASLRIVMEQLVVLMDIVMNSVTIQDPRFSVTWQNMAYEALHHGSGWSVQPSQMACLCGVLGIRDELKEPLDPSAALTWIFERLEDRKGFCWSRIVRGQRGCWS